MPLVSNWKKYSKNHIAKLGQTFFFSYLVVQKAIMPLVCNICTLRYNFI